jgi:hypothetical protein
MISRPRKKKGIDMCREWYIYRQTQKEKYAQRIGFREKGSVEDVFDLGT